MTAAIILAAFSVFGGVMIPLSVEKLSNKADIIVQGVVTNKVCLQDDAGRIYTRVDLQITEVIKGTNVGDTLSVIHGGGTIGDRRVEVSGQVEYETGKEVVSFLVRNPKGQAITVGLSQGKFGVWQDGDGEKFVHNPCHGSPPQALSAVAKQTVAVDSEPRRLKLADLKQQIRQIRP